MGRPAGRFTAAKTFTLDIMTLEWLNRTCLERKMKASALLTEIIEKYRISLKKEIPENVETIIPNTQCPTCEGWTPHTLDMVCTECNKLNYNLKAKIDRRNRA
jgi:hypothetical protein